MTPAATKIDNLMSYSISDWAVTDSDEVAILGVFRTDPNPIQTVNDLVGARRFETLLQRVSTHRRQLIELLGGRLSTTAAATITRSIAALGDDYGYVFAISNDLQANLQTLGRTPTIAHSPMVKVRASGSSNAPFTGSGATGTDPASLSIPLADRVRLLAGHNATVRLYTNPIPGSLPVYLASLSAAQRRGQALTLLEQPIVSFVPASYAGDIPDRVDIMRLAAKLYNLDGPTLAAFILAEQRDQSANEDAKDLIAATSFKHANTSIGLGQVVVSTARTNDLFSDLISAHVRKKLMHEQIARLLASDEFNIFAVAKYIRIVANSGAKLSIARSPATKAKFPSISMPAFAGNSSSWPADNLRALGSEYTSAPWDDRLSPGWGDFVSEARRDVLAAGVF